MQDNKADGRGRPRKGTGPAADRRAEAPFAVAFGALLRRLRDDAGLTGRQLADRAGLSRDTLQQYESGRNAPKLEQAGKLVAALGLSLAVLDPLFISRAAVPAAPAPAPKRKAARRTTTTRTRSKAAKG